MKYDRFEELPVWKDAIELAVEVFALTQDPAFKGMGDLRNQIERAATSISNNVAEGFERGTTQELLTFLYIARGSAGEVRSMTYVLDRLPPFAHLNAQIQGVRGRSESIARQLRAWAFSLQNSDIKGQRYLNDQVLRDQQRKKEQAEFDAELQQILQKAAAERAAAAEQAAAKREAAASQKPPDK
jgi:four helix bundle protein